MAKKSDKTAIYCFDSSAFIWLHQSYPKSRVPDIWEQIDLLFKSGHIISHETVYDELLPDPKKPDELGKYIQKKDKYFVTTSQVQLNKVGDILKNFPKLINPNQERTQADPWLVAMMAEYKENQESGLFSEEHDYFLVTQESTRSDQKLPAACKKYGIQHLSVFEFFDKQGWKLGLVK